MIQRIQTLHLLAATVLTAVLLVVPLAWYADCGQRVTLHAFELRTTAEYVAEAMPSEELPTMGAVAAEVTQQALPPYLGMLLAVAAVLPFVTIFLYRRRLLQIRLCAVEMVLLLGVVAMEVIYYFRFKALFADMATTVSHVSLKMTMAFPLLALFLVWLAMRAIFRDEMLVRAADRIR